MVFLHVSLPTYHFPCVQSGGIGGSPLASPLGKQWVQAVDVFSPFMSSVGTERTLRTRACSRSTADQNSPTQGIQSTFERMPYVGAQKLGVEFFLE